MCLVSATLKRKTFLRRITIYKILCPAINGGLYTPYQTYPIPKIPYRQIPKEKDTCITHGFPPFWISSGYIHAYTKLKRAINVANSYNTPYVIVKGYIPRGAYYFIGCNDDICADKMQLTKVIKEHHHKDYPYYYCATKLYRRSWWLKLCKLLASIKCKNYFSNI